MNLEDKFTELESQMTTQQTEVINALNAILEALGAPPPTATITLATISTQLTALNNNLIGIAIANGSFHAALLSLVGQINTNTDLMLTNNSLNAQRLIAALYATFCECATDAPLLAPPIDVTPTVIVDEAKCRRIQFYLSVFGTWLNSIANYGAAGASITGGTLAYLLSVAAADAGIIATGVEVGAVGGIPGVVAGAVIGLIVVAVYTFGGSVLVDYANQFNDATLQDNLLMALYNEDNAEDGYIAFKDTIIAGMDNIPAQIIYSLWWSAWSNDIYSGSPVVDDSAFDGSICVPEVVFPPTVGCVSLSSVEEHQSDGQVLQCIPWPSGFGSYVSPASASGAPADLTSDYPIFGTADINGLWVTSVPTCHTYLNATGYPNMDIGATPVHISGAGTYYTFLTPGTPFTVTFCVDEPL